MDRRIALVTGASSGLGLETALALVRRGLFVVMLCRNRERGERALAAVRRQSGREDAALMVCDLADMADIRRFCNEFAATHQHLDVLVNNAGVLCFRRAQTKDALEMHFGVCHIGHFLLTNLLLPHMGAGARIVVLGSSAHRAGRIRFNDLAMVRGYTVARAYSRAKLCNLLFAQALMRRLQGRGISVHCVHPGAVATNIGARRRNDTTSVGFVRRAAGRLLSAFVKTPAQAAAMVARVADEGADGGMRGLYLVHGKPALPSAQARSEMLADKLWSVSEQIVGLSEGADGRVSAPAEATP